MTTLIMARNNQHGRLAWLVSSDGKHFYLAMQDRAWFKPIFKAFSTKAPEFLQVCKALKQ